jgi:hypothetical protein
MSIIFSTGILCSFGFRRGFITRHPQVMIAQAEVRTCVSTIDIPGAIRYIQATLAGQVGAACQREGARCPPDPDLMLGKCEDEG